MGQVGMRPRTIYEQHYEVCRIVENGTDWADVEDEAAQFTNGPFARFVQPIGIHLVSRDGGLREIV